MIKARLAADRALPKGGLGDRVWDDMKDAAESLGRNILALRGNPLPIGCELPLTNNRHGLPDLTVKVTGQVLLTADGTHLLAYRAGKAEEARHFVGPWIEAIFAAADGHNLPTVFLSETHPDRFPENTLDEMVLGGDFRERMHFIDRIQELVCGYLLGRQRPLCYAPATSDAIAGGLYPEKDANRLDLPAAIQKARAGVWDRKSFGNMEGEGEKAAARMAWRDRDPFAEQQEWKHWVDTVAGPLRNWGKF